MVIVEMTQSTIITVARVNRGRQAHNDAFIMCRWNSSNFNKQCYDNKMLKGMEETNIAATMMQMFHSECRTFDLNCNSGSHQFKT